jgi:uncharacterized protein (DUF58 family)
VTLGAWGLVAHDSGAGWVQAIGAVLAAVLVTGLVAPAAVVARVRIRCETCPHDATAGLPVVLSVRASHRVRAWPVSPPGPEVAVGPTERGRPRDAGGDELTLLPRRRGVHTSVVVELSSAAPFALLWWSRRVVVPLPVDLHVGPATGAPLALPPRPDDLSGTWARPLADVVGEPRGVRAYQPGDSRRRVHWPATAHHGTLMVRETERPATAGVVIRVSMPTDPDAAERTAERALGTVVAAIDRGVPVVLETFEATGPCTAAVNDRRTAGRRLARAVSGTGPLGAGPGGAGAADDATGVVTVEDVGGRYWEVSR